MFYYLQSRYYDPYLGRFINADGYASTGTGFNGYNAYAYCNNDPVNKQDESGELFKWIKNVADRVKATAKKVANKIKKTVNNIVTTVKKKAYETYYNATKWHFEDRIAKNTPQPTYQEVTGEGSNWTKVPEDQTRYHDNGSGENEEKYTHTDGREAVYDGDTLEIVTDPLYMGTYNYCPIVQIPESNANWRDYVVFAATWVGHGTMDVIPYYLTLKCNTREQFEEKIAIFD